MRYRELNEYLTIIGWNKRILADRLDVNQRLILRWANGQNEIPESVLAWLDLLAQCHLDNELPDGWGPAPVVMTVPRAAHGGR